MDIKHKFGFISLTEKVNICQDLTECDGDCAGDWDGDNIDYVDLDRCENREIIMRWSDVLYIAEVNFPNTATMWCIRVRGVDRAMLIEESPAEIFKQLENIHPSML